MVRHVVEVDCDCAFVEEVNTLHPNLCYLLDLLGVRTVFLAIFGSRWVQIDAVDAQLLGWLVNLGCDNLI